MQYVAEPLHSNSTRHIIRRTYVNDHNALVAKNCIAKYATPRLVYRVYRINLDGTHTVIFTGRFNRN